jgi:threonine/homoserine/homoserine lactone efflux protein
LAASLPFSPSVAAFLLASLVLAVAPGPGILYIVTRSATQGRGPGLVSVGGVALGNLGNVVGAAFGLAALFAVSSFAFAIVKYIGAAYLIYLGIKTLRSREATFVNPEISHPADLFQVFRDGFAVALFNPKTALFFAAYLPQFLPASKAPMTQTLLFGSTFVLIAATTDSLYALAAGSLKLWLSRGQRVSDFGRTLSGTVYISLGLFTAFTSHRMKSYSLQ